MNKGMNPAGSKRKRIRGLGLEHAIKNPNKLRSRRQKRAQRKNK